MCPSCYSLKQWILKRFYDTKAVATTFISLKSMSYNNKVWEKIKYRLHALSFCCF